jgi:hypothetical protein
MRGAIAVLKAHEGYSDAACEKLSEREQLLSAPADDSNRPNDDRAQAARQLLDQLLAARRSHALARIGLRPTYTKLAGLTEPMRARCYGAHRTSPVALSK